MGWQPEQSEACDFKALVEYFHEDDKLDEQHKAISKYYPSLVEQVSIKEDEEDDEFEL